MVKIDREMISFKFSEKNENVEGFALALNGTQNLIIVGDNQDETGVRISFKQNEQLEVQDQLLIATKRVVRPLKNPAP